MVHVKKNKNKKWGEKKHFGMDCFLMGLEQVFQPFHSFLLQISCDAMCLVSFDTVQIYFEPCLVLFLDGFEL